MRKTCKYLPITILPFLFLSGMDAAASTALREFCPHGMVFNTYNN